MDAVRITKDRLSPAQLRALQAQRRSLGLDEETYRRALKQYRCYTAAPDGALGWPTQGAPCTSSRHLSRAQARSLITRWGIAGAPVGKPYTGSRVEAREEQAAGVTPLSTPAQRALIGRLVAEVQWRTEDGFHRWMASRSSPLRGRAMRSFFDAEAVIDALKNLRDHTHADA